MAFALVLTPVLVLIPLLAFLVPVLFRLWKPCESSEITVEWFDSFQVSSYYPMEGLLTVEDFQFLSRQPGFDRSLHRKLRRDRLRIFRQYLNRMVLDFNRLHTLARLIISQRTEDQSDLFQRVLMIRFHFWTSIVRVELSYFASRFGMQPAGVGRAIQQLEQMSRQLATLPSSQSLLAN